MRNEFLLVGLALAALTIHLAVPFAHVDEIAEDGDTTARTYWTGAWSEREEVFDAVSGGSMGYALTGIVIFVAGVAGVAGLTAFPRVAWGRWPMRAAYGVLALGTALSVHAQALWTGRGFATLIQVILGTDGPARHHQADAFTPDFYSHFWAISPPLVLAAVLACFILAVRAAPAALGTRDTLAGRHAATAIFGVVAVALALTVPWAVQTMDDNTAPVDEQQDRDPFVISMYDALRIHQDTSAIAADAGESGLEEYTEIAFLGGAMAPLFMASIALAGLAGVIGVERVESNEKVTGRTIQYVAAGTVVALAVVFAFTAILVAALLWAPNDRLASEGGPALVPLLAAVPAAIAIIRAIGALRVVGSERDTLIADDFPEPIVYD